MSRAEAIAAYHDAQKRGERYYNSCVARGEYPYPRVLEDVVDESMELGQVDIGEVDIPMELIIGTRAAGRKNAFAGNFMPLLRMETEFGAKWTALCEAHLSADGISDPISCIEYMGKFYVQEGHKRVSVMRFFGAPSIRGTVTRVIPAWSKDPKVQAYYEFMAFHRLSGQYLVSLDKPGAYQKLQKLLGFEPQHVWTEDERSEFRAVYFQVESALEGRIAGEARDITPSEALMACLEVFPYEELKKATADDIKKRLIALMPDLRFVAADEPTAVSTEPSQPPEKSLVGRILDGLNRPTLRIAFIHASDPENSSWSRGHDEGCRYLEQQLGDRIQVKRYIAVDDADAVMETAVKEGAQLLICTAPALLAASRRIAAANPALKVLVCALSVPAAGVRTYYSRIYEAKLITGAIAGAMCGGESIGYLARYPIMGTPAAINAFALGVRMTAPEARIHLGWSSMTTNPLQILRKEGVRIVSGHETFAQANQEAAPGWSTSLLLPDGGYRPLASACWNWGRLYVLLVQGVLDGSWDAFDPTRASAVTYWWGMSSGVIDVQLAPDLPAGVAQLADILKRGLADGSLQPFHCPMRDQQGRVRSEGDRWLSPQEIMHMNWLMERVIGRIPTADEVLPMSRETTRLLALQADTGEAEEEAEAPAPKSAPAEDAQADSAAAQK
ncbi:MAG: BMP family ABC transporter substrate-binding protein [Clostridia bacterium]|nr:BMP family ABC transporter substrate-binding protein [Clostridia bacterium]